MKMFSKLLVKLRLWAAAVMDGGIACKLCQRVAAAAVEQGTCTIYIRMGFQIEKCGRSFFDSFAGSGTCRMRNQRDSRMFLVCDRNMCSGNKRKRSRLKSRSPLNLIREKNKKVDENGRGQSLLSLDCSIPPFSRESVPLLKEGGNRLKRPT